jgi:Orsellinic acid/F9775 biosynthesis cluster protein D
MNPKSKPKPKNPKPRPKPGNVPCAICNNGAIKGSRHQYEYHSPFSLDVNGVTTLVKHIAGTGKLICPLCGLPLKGRSCLRRHVERCVASGMLYSILDLITLDNFGDQEHATATQSYSQDVSEPSTTISEDRGHITATQFRSLIRNINLDNPLDIDNLLDETLNIDKPMGVDEPVDVGGPVDEPVDVDEPEPVDIDEPMDADEPVDVDEPVDEPVDVDEPEPVDIDEPVDINKPVDADESVDVDEPVDVNVDEPVDVDEPLNMNKPLGIGERLDMTCAYEPSAIGFKITTTHALDDLYLVHAPDYGLLICSHCRHGVWPEYVITHIKKTHRDIKKSQHDVDSALRGLHLLEPYKFRTPVGPIAPVRVLKPPVKGYRCLVSHCGYCAPEKVTLQRHIRRHAKADGKEYKPSSRFFQGDCELQRIFSNGAGSAFFHVDPDLSNVRPGDRFHNFYLSLSDSDSDICDPKDSDQQDMDVSPFLHETGWLGVIEGYSYSSLIKQTAVKRASDPESWQQVITLAKAYLGSVSPGQWRRLHPNIKSKLISWKTYR